MKLIWKYFNDLDRKRSNNGYGPLPLQYSEILAYFQIFNIYYEPMEVEIICLLDDVAMSFYVKKIKEDAAKNNNKK